MLLFDRSFALLEQYLEKEKAEKFQRAGQMDLINPWKVFKHDFLRSRFRACIFHQPHANFIDDFVRVRGDVAGSC
jgi:hypothetical protein